MLSYGGEVLCDLSLMLAPQLKLTSNIMTSSVMMMASKAFLVDLIDMRRPMQQIRIFRSLNAPR